MRGIHGYLLIGNCDEKVVGSKSHMQETCAQQIGLKYVPILPVVVADDFL
jgi:hypothetical protein